MKLKEVQEMNKQELLEAFYWVTVRATNETNFKRNGMTKQTEKEEKWILAELEKRFEINLDGIRDK
jgi:hypothetical protein